MEVGEFAKRYIKGRYYVEVKGRKFPSYNVNIFSNIYYYEVVSVSCNTNYLIIEAKPKKVEEQ